MSDTQLAVNATCTNCGKDMGRGHSENSEMYCNDELCRKVFMQRAIAETTKPKRKRSKTPPVSE